MKWVAFSLVFLFFQNSAVATPRNVIGDAVEHVASLSRVWLEHSDSPESREALAESWRRAMESFLEFRGERRDPFIIRITDGDDAARMTTAAEREELWNGALNFAGAQAVILDDGIELLNPVITFDGTWIRTAEELRTLSRNSAGLSGEHNDRLDQFAQAVSETVSFQYGWSADEALFDRMIRILSADGEYEGANILLSFLRYVARSELEAVKVIELATDAHLNGVLMLERGVLRNFALRLEAIRKATVKRDSVRRLVQEDNLLPIERNGRGLRPDQTSPLYRAIDSVEHALFMLDGSPIPGTQ